MIKIDKNHALVKNGKIVAEVVLTLGVSAIVAGTLSKIVDHETLKPYKRVAVSFTGFVVGSLVSGKVAKLMDDNIDETIDALNTQFEMLEAKKGEA